MFLAIIVIAIGLIILVIKSPLFKTFILKDTEEKQEGFLSHPNFTHLLNKEGKAITDLRPAGTVLIDDKRYDVVTEGDYVSVGERITVYQVEGGRIVVRKINA